MMKKKIFVWVSLVLAFFWALFSFYFLIFKSDFGIFATLGGIALMFAWMGHQTALKS
jgi:hypothetical protein